MRRAARRVAMAASLLALGACALLRPVGLSEVIERPAERALLAGWRAYDDANYGVAERELVSALGFGLRSAKDRATAHKLLAFVYCTSRRLEQCEQSFRAARAADPAFALGRAEAGHPLWGPVYLRAAAR
jgi:Tfp pilus assembly protein PilF